MVRFTCHDRFPTGAGGWYAHYDHLPPPSAEWQECDIRSVLDAAQRRWIDDFDRWHAELCRLGAARSSRWWWASVSRPNLWAQAGSLKPLFVAAAIAEWLGTHPDTGHVSIIGAPAEVGRYLEEFGARRDAARPNPRRSRIIGLRRFAAQALALRHYLVRRPPVTRCRVLFYSHLFFPAHGTGDHFFGPIPAMAALAGPDAVQVAYYVDGRGDVSAVRRDLRARPVKSFALLDGLTAGDVVAVLARCGWLAWRLSGLESKLPPIRLGSWESRSFVRAYLADELSAMPPLMEFAIQRAFKRALQRARPDVVIYPYEEKGLERALIETCRQAGVRTIGYAHPAQTTAHLALRSRPPGQTGPPAPDLITTAGPLECELLTTWGRKDPARVTSFGSHRHRPPLAAPRSAAERRGTLRILMITGHGFELSILANLVERRPDVFGDDEVVIRKTGGGWFEAQASGIRRLTALSAGIRVGTGTLVEQLEWCDLAIFSSTTAGVETMLAGRLAVYVALHDIFEADPLLGEAGAFARCSDGSDLAEALARARELDAAGYEAAVARQMALAERILAPLDAIALRKMIGLPHRPAEQGSALSSTVSAHG